MSSVFEEQWGRLWWLESSRWGQHDQGEEQVKYSFAGFRKDFDFCSEMGKHSGAAAAAAKSLQSCQLCATPMDCSPPGSPIPGILQARTLEWVAIFFSNAWKWKWKWSCSVLSNLSTPWTAAVGFSRQEYWSGVPLPSPKHSGAEDQ